MRIVGGSLAMSMTVNITGVTYIQIRIMYGSRVPVSR